jgi:hypothetical protein
MDILNAGKKKMKLEGARLIHAFGNAGQAANVC